MSINPALVAAMGGKAANGIFVDMSIDGPEIGSLIVFVDRAKNLPSRRSMGKQDPYCAVRYGKEVRKTETDRRGGQTPRWEQEFRYIVHDSPDYFKLKMSVFNDDKRTELIGEAWLTLIDVIVPGGGQTETWQSLQCKGKYAGEVRLVVRYEDTRPAQSAPLPIEQIPVNSATLRGSRRDCPPTRRQPIAADTFNPQPPNESDHQPGRKQYQAYSPQRAQNYQDAYRENSHPDEYLKGHYDEDPHPEYDVPHSRSPGHLPQFHSSDTQGEYYPQEEEYSRNHQQYNNSTQYAPFERSYMDRSYHSDQQFRPNRLSPSPAHHTPDRSPVDDFEPRPIQRAETMPVQHTQPRHYDTYEQFSEYPALSHGRNDLRAGYPSQGRYADDMPNHGAPPPPTHRRPYNSRPNPEPSSQNSRLSHPRNLSPGRDYRDGPYEDQVGPDPRTHARRHTVQGGIRMDPYLDSPSQNRHSMGPGLQDPALSLPQLPPGNFRYHRAYDPSSVSPSHPPPPDTAAGSVKYKRLPPRKSIGSSIAVSPTPFSPESFDAYNPNVRQQQAISQRTDNRHSPSPMGTISEAQNDEPPQIINLQGAVVDPSEHLPIDTWAPEPEKLSPTKTVNTSQWAPERERPIGARDPRSNRWNGQQQTGGAAVGPGPAHPPLPNNQTPYGSVGRVRGMGATRTGPPTPAGDRHGRYATVGGRPSSGRGYVSDYDSVPLERGGREGGARIGHQMGVDDRHHYHQRPPPGPHQPVQPSYGDDLNALSAEIQMIDIGTGGSRRRLRASESTFY